MGDIYNDIILVLPDEIIFDAYIEIEAGIIKSFGKTNNQTPNTIAPKKIVMSGFIDTHVHGLMNYDTFKTEDLPNISEALVKEGVTAFLATTSTRKLRTIIDFLDRFDSHKAKHARCLGVHLEGPFINPTYKGIQDESSILKGDVNQLSNLENHLNKIKIMTIAPEVCEEDFIKGLVLKDIVLSIGHSSATEADFNRAYHLGVKRITHAFNAMKGIHHRDVDANGMGLLYDDVSLEIIADLEHINDSMLKLIFKMEKTRIELVTDSIKSKGTHASNKTDAGVLKGGHGTIIDMVKTLHNKYNIPLNHITQFTSLNPAKTLKLKQMGEIKVGYKADLVFLDESLNLIHTMLNGKLY
jgi:N-acetylglucosamine-6-phosphate deacetylase